MGVGYFTVEACSLCVAACMLARGGYDVWVTNARGNSYSTRHTILDPDRDKERYWDFSFHEMAVRDLPATIDYIRKHTKKDKFSYIGHGLGGTMDFTLLSEVPHYNRKINVAVSLAPAVYNYEEEIDKIEWSPGKQPYSKRSDDMEEFKLQARRTLDCVLEKTGQKRGLLRDFGCDTTSVKNCQHILQNIWFGRFQKFSYGEDKNKKVYGSPEPPLYKLRNVKTPHFIMYADMDILTPAKVVERLCSDLPKNVRVCKRVEKSDFGHFDFTASHDAKQYVNDEILKVLRKHLPAPPTTPTPPTTTPVNPECIV